MSEVSSNKRIAKNTLVLYVRTIFVMVISLFSSRIILDALGIDDYGIYNVVGGIVTMLSVVTGALSTSISRFLTYELGKGDKKKLNKIFSTSINIQILISLIIIVLGESLGLWFLNTYMNIPPARLTAANWVLQCSIFSFVTTQISVPYNALIIAHEKMSIFAYISIFEAVAKLGIAYYLYISPTDRLIIYSILLLALAIIIRIYYGYYCGKNFEEAHYKRVHDKSLFKEMTSFAGWGFFVNTAYVFNTQGVNILINLFFSVGLNAARGLAVQVESILNKFVLDFMTALNPQITKSYAKGEYENMNNLVIRGAKFSMLLFLFLSMPVLIETDFILNLWLKQVPDHTVNFIRLSIIGSMIMSVGNTGYTACMATGKIKKYSIWVTVVGCLVFPLSWVCFKFGAPVESTYIVFIFVYLGVDFVRLWIMRSLLDFPVMKFVKEVFGIVLIVAFLSAAVPLFVFNYFPFSITRFIINIFLCVICTSIVIWFVGVNQYEKNFIKNNTLKLLRRK